jgi:hypothetical protein
MNEMERRVEKRRLGGKGKKRGERKIRKRREEKRKEGTGEKTR